MWAGCCSLVPLAVALAPAAAGTAPVIGPSEDELRSTLARPRLEHCDELVCYYRPRRNYEIRGLHCRTLEARKVLCSYERTIFDLADVLVTPNGIAAPVAAREWTWAETTLEALGEHWIVLADSDD